MIFAPNRRLPPSDRCHLEERQFLLSPPPFFSRKQVKHCGFVLVAGGLGERLGYGDIKLRLPSETCSMTPYLQLYIRQILHLQVTWENMFSMFFLSEESVMVAIVMFHLLLLLLLFFGLYRCCFVTHGSNDTWSEQKVSSCLPLCIRQILDSIQRPYCMR